MLELLFFNFKAFVSILSKNLPSFHEIGLILFKERDHVFSWEVVLFKLLDNNEDEQVEHDITADQDDSKEVNEGLLLSTSLSRDTLRRSPTTVKHNLVPIFSCGNGEQEQEGIKKVIEVLEVIDYLSRLDVSKHEHSQD